VAADVRSLDLFKAYDVRGRVPDEFDADLAFLIGRAYAGLFDPRRVAVGRDMRLTGPAIGEAVTRGLTGAGVDVVDIGMVGTEQVYFATFALQLDGGIMVTASHNPADYNGMKLVRKEAIPVSGDTGLGQMRDWVAAALTRGEAEEAEPGGPPPDRPPREPGTVETRDVREPYVEHLLTYVDRSALTPLRIVANGGDGMAGPVIELLRPHLPFEFILLNGTPDGSFPHGVPNPLLPESREATARAVLEAGADLGLAWDGDFDRCFFFDETGAFIEGYYLVGLLAEQALRRHPGAAIVHDPRLVWNTREVVEAAGGRAVMNKSGHAFIKERMRLEDAVYGGEMSAHHYFREFSYCDSGMIPWLIVCELLGRTAKPLSAFVEDAVRRYPASGEINLELADPPAALARLREVYAPQASALDETDGLSLEFPDWRVNVRMSNTEPVVRVNLEARGDVGLLERKTEEIVSLLTGA
jgi:phosphomannomutase